MSRSYLIGRQSEAEAAVRRLRRHGHVVALEPSAGAQFALVVEGEASLDVVECLIATAPSARPADGAVIG